MTTDKRKPTKNMPNSKTNKKMEAQAEINFLGGGVGGGQKATVTKKAKNSQP